MQLKYREENSDILFFENKFAEVKKAIKNTLKAIESGVVTKTLPARLAELENEQESIEAELAIAKATDVVITPDQIEFLLWQFSQPQKDETEDDYRRRIIKCFVHKVFLFDDKLLVYYNVSRDGKTREQSNVELLEEALSAGFDQRSSGSTTRMKVGVLNSFVGLSNTPAFILSKKRVAPLQRPVLPCRHLRHDLLTDMDKTIKSCGAAVNKPKTGRQVPSGFLYLRTYPSQIICR